MSKESLNELGAAIDAATDNGDASELRRLIDRCTGITAVLKEGDVALAQYFRANAFAALRQLEPVGGAWAWSNPLLQEEVLSLRRAIRHPGFQGLHALRRAQIFTNLANAFNHLGRTVEALELYDRALEAWPLFAMALGNRGLARMTLARSLYHPHDKVTAMVLAHQDLLATEEPTAFYEAPMLGAKAFFLKLKRSIEERLDLNTVIGHIDVGDVVRVSPSEPISYSSWMVTHRMYLHPLNVLGPFCASARDVLTLPAHRVLSGEPPQFVAYFNQMVREFATARSMYFESIQRRDHYSDHDLTLVDTGDRPAFSMAVEQVRTSFRLSYSLLDKIAGFLNVYLALNIRPDRVAMHKMWIDKSSELNAAFVDRENLSLRGLYWLSRDVSGGNKGEDQALEPDAEGLADLRNALEHRCLMLREDPNEEPMGIVETMHLGDFQAKALRLLKLVRAALIHLALAVHQEERAKQTPGPRSTATIPLPTYQPMFPRS